MNWQPIKSAPIGENILIANGDGCCVGYLQVTANGGGIFWLDASLFGAPDVFIECPTHWMPLPEPPKGGA